MQTNSLSKEHQDIVVAIDYSKILFRTLQQQPKFNDGHLEEFLSGTSLDPEDFFNKEGYINWPDQHRIILNAIKLSHTPALGILAGRSYTLATHGLVGVAATASRSIADSLRTIEQFQKTRAQFSESSFLENSSHYILRHELRVDHDEAGQFLLEALTMSMVLALDFLAGQRLPDIDIRLNCPAPDYADLINDQLQAIVSYNHQYAEMHIPKAYGELPLASHNEAMRKMAEEQCERLFQQLNNDHRLSNKILTLLRQTPGKRPSQPEMAQALNISTRTLLRHLKEEGTTYQALVDEEYKRLAQHYLSKTDLTIEAIAICMGYHDLSSFRRAFKRWFNIPPSQYPR
ncbi:MAG: AraC family transcriptional regulator [Pseudomonadales bacterium]|nr:AraC family transcriptional regulator [Pseudomonadales bacterium]